MMSSSLDVQEWLRINPPQTCDDARISQPTRLGLGWTKSGETTNQYSHGDFSGLHAVQMPTAPLDLNQGIDKFTPKTPDNKAGVEILIHEAFAAGAPLEKCDILTFRNNLNKIFGTVFNPEAAWIVDATRREMSPTLFLDIVMNEDDEMIKSGANQGAFEAWGYNFEAMCTGEPYADANSEYGMLINFKLEHRNKIDKTSIEENERVSVILGAEIDAYDPVEAHSDSSDVQSIPPVSSLREIKTFTRPEHPGQWRTTYNVRHPKWWLQSYLAGVPAIILGARDRSGIVHEIHTIATNDLPKISWQNGCRWSPQQALAFGGDVLAWMTGVCRSENCINKHVRFKYDPSARKIYAKVLEGEKADLPKRVNAALLQHQQQQDAQEAGS